jgi:hypothetical protein
MGQFLTVYVDNSEIAQHFREEPQALLNVLSMLIDGMTEDGAMRYCHKVAGGHEGTVGDSAVAPFLGVLRRALEAEAAAIGAA